MQSFQVRGVGDLNAMEAQTRWSFYPSVLLQGNWTSPQTNKLLLEAGWSATMQPIAGNREIETDNLGFTVSPNDVAITELTHRFTYNARPTYYGPERLQRPPIRRAVRRILCDRLARLQDRLPIAARIPKQRHRGQSAT